MTMFQKQLVVGFRMFWNRQKFNVFMNIRATHVTRQNTVFVKHGDI